MEENPWNINSNSKSGNMNTIAIRTPQFDLIQSVNINAEKLKIKKEILDEYSKADKKSILEQSQMLNFVNVEVKKEPEINENNILEPTCSVSIKVEKQDNFEKSKNILDINPINNAISKVDKDLRNTEFLTENFSDLEEKIKYVNTKKIKKIRQECNVTQEPLNIRKCDKNEKSNNKNLKCHLCKINFDKPFHLKSHNEEIHRGVNIKCDKCDKNFSGSANLKRHIAIYHEEVQYKCEFCSENFSKSLNLKVLELPSISRIKRSIKPQRVQFILRHFYFSKIIKHSLGLK